VPAQGWAPVAGTGAWQSGDLPLHGWKLRLDSGEAVAPDQGCSRSYPIRVESGTVFLEI
jgi:nitrite reductase (NADH) small subunit